MLTIAQFSLDDILANPLYIFIAIAGILILIFIVNLIRLPFKIKKVRSNWQAVCDELGLENQSTIIFTMGGNYQDFDVKVTASSRDEGDQYTFCEANFPQPLNMSLLIDSNKNWFSDAVNKVISREEVEIGEADFDKNFTVQASDELQLKYLLQNQPSSPKTAKLTDDLLLAKDLFSNVRVTERSVYIEEPDHIFDANKLREMLDWATDLAKKIQAKGY